MNTSDPISLQDSKHGLTCREVPVDRKNAALVARLKAYVINGFTKQGYEGFSPEIDAYYDPFSTYFLVENQGGKLLAALRITEKTKDNALPLEHGLMRDGGSYRLETEDKVADANSFVFTNPAALPLLFAAIARFAVRRGIATGLLLADNDSARFKKIYLGGGYKYSEKYAEPIYFPTFGKTVEGRFQPTYWSIMEIDRAAILKYAGEQPSP